MAEASFLGEPFEVAEKVGLMPLMQFAVIAKTGADTESLDGLVAMHNLIRECVRDEDEWERFQAHAVAQHADGDDLLKFVTDAMEVLTARPTSRPSDSSDGPGTTERRSEGASSSRVIHRLEDQGRPDLALLVQQTSQAG